MRLKIIFKNEKYKIICDTTNVYLFIFFFIFNAPYHHNYRRRRIKSCVLIKQTRVISCDMTFSFFVLSSKRSADSRTRPGRRLAPGPATSSCFYSRPAARRITRTGSQNPNNRNTTPYI